MRRGYALKFRCWPPRCTAGGSTMASQALVSPIIDTAVPLAASPEEGSPQRLAFGSISATAVGVAPVLNHLLQQCDPVIHTISSATAPSTQQIYTSHWRLFSLCIELNLHSGCIPPDFVCTCHPLVLYCLWGSVGMKQKISYKCNCGSVNPR